MTESCRDLSTTGSYSDCSGDCVILRVVPFLSLLLVAQEPVALSIIPLSMLAVDTRSFAMERSSAMTAPAKSIPDGYHTVTPHLVNENVSGLIEFLKCAFEAEEVHRLSGPNGGVLHAELRIGDSMVMIGEASREWKTMPSSIALYVKDVDATCKRALDAGAVSLKEPMDQFYGDRSGG